MVSELLPRAVWNNNNRQDNKNHPCMQNEYQEIKRRHSEKIVKIQIRLKMKFIKSKRQSAANSAEHEKLRAREAELRKELQHRRLALFQAKKRLRTVMGFTDYYQQRNHTGLVKRQKLVRQS